MNIQYYYYILDCGNETQKCHGKMLLRLAVTTALGSEPFAFGMVNDRNNLPGEVVQVASVREFQGRRGKARLSVFGKGYMSLGAEEDDSGG